VLGVAFRGEHADAIAVVGTLVALVGAYLVNTGVRVGAAAPRRVTHGSATSG
jgi:hypothetical protein